jgi:hypothetical protein
MKDTTENSDLERRCLTHFLIELARNGPNMIYNYVQRYLNIFLTFLGTLTRRGCHC